MPRGDRSGPMGTGAMSGRAAGYCAGFGMPGFSNPGPGRGFAMGYGRGRGGWGCGFGGGRGWRNMFYATGQPRWMRTGYAYPAAYPQPDPEFEKKALKSQSEALQSELDAVKKRLADIESESAAES